MKKAGYTIINKKRNGGKPAICASCGGKGAFLVTFIDYYGKLIVPLCKECHNKPYELLCLQTRFDWPIAQLNHKKI